MPIRVQCSCGKRLAFPDGTEGRYGKCKQCGGLHRYRPSADAPAQLAKRSTL